MTQRYRTLAATGALMLALVAASTPAEARWSSFGAPAQHTDHIGVKNDAGIAAFNLNCLANNNDVELQVVGGPGGKTATLTLTIDGKVVAKHAADVTPVGSTAMIEFGGPNTDGDVARWLHGIASATSDITISAGRSAGHFSVDGARSAATTALSYCKLK